MFRKALTNLIIMALTVLPVQVISASAENVDMQMSMTQVSNDCMHGQSSEHQSVEKSCCDDQSHQCESCNNCPQVASAMVLTAQHQTVQVSIKKQVLFSSHLLLSGTPQNNLLRPPRTII